MTYSAKVQWLAWPFGSKELLSNHSGYFRKKRAMTSNGSPTEAAAKAPKTPPGGEPLLYAPAHNSNEKVRLSGTGYPQAAPALNTN